MHQRGCLFNKISAFSFFVESNVQNRLGKFQQADVIFRSLTLTNPALTWAHVSRANLLMDYGGQLTLADPVKQIALWTRAMEEYQFANQLTPTDWSARIGLAMYFQVS